MLELLTTLTVLTLLTLALKALFRLVKRRFPGFAERTSSIYLRVANATNKAMTWLTGT